MITAQSAGAAARAPGRPPRVAGEPATERIWAWLTKAERLALQAAAREDGRPIAVLIREAINVYVAEYSERTVFSVTGK